VKISFMPMARELAKRGHNVTIVSPHKDKKATPGITDLVHENIFGDMFQKMSSSFLKEDSKGMQDAPLHEMMFATINSNRIALQNPLVQQMLADENIKVDVMITAPLVGNEAGYFVAAKKDASIVQFIGAPFFLPWVAAGLGNPVNPSYMPIPLLPLSQNMNFKERLMNSIATFGFLTLRKLYMLPQVEKMIREVYPEETDVDLDALSRTAALAINMGSPFLGDGLRPLLPNSIQAGLMSCDEGSPLEGELKDWVEGAKHGVIYLSFGSVVKSSEMPESRRKMFINVLSQLKQRVIWKWDKEMPDAPANVLISSWLPQTDVLAHPNVKMFITHGGAGSIQETICHRTPVVGIPLNGDQVLNLAEAVSKHIGEVINWWAVTEDNLLQAINTVVTDPSYQDSVNQLQANILDVPVHPRDRAVWWLEYLLRHPHNTGMSSPTHQLNWIQYNLLDVMFVILGVAALVVLALVKLIQCCCCRRSGSKQKRE